MRVIIFRFVTSGVSHAICAASIINYPRPLRKSVVYQSGNILLASPFYDRCGHGSSSGRDDYWHVALDIKNVFACLQNAIKMPFSRLIEGR